MCSWNIKSTSALAVWEVGDRPEWLIFGDERRVVGMGAVNGMAALVEEGFYRGCFTGVKKALGTAYVDAVGIDAEVRGKHESQVKRGVHLVLRKYVDERLTHIP
jgi:hypothetical protein